MPYLNHQKGYLRLYKHWCCRNHLTHTTIFHAGKENRLTCAIRKFYVTWISIFTRERNLTFSPPLRKIKILSIQENQFIYFFFSVRKIYSIKQRNSKRDFPLFHMILLLRKRTLDEWQNFMKFLYLYEVVW